MEPNAILVKNLIDEFLNKLVGQYHRQEIMQFTYILLESILGWEKTKVHLSYYRTIPSPALEALNQALDELLAGKPIQYIIGSTSFNGARMSVTPAVLIPRPETEELCAVIKSDHPGQLPTGFSMLDIGTGSGCIAIDLKKHFPGAVVEAIDISYGALEIAQANALYNNCKINFQQVDILNRTGWGRLGKYHLIVSNPPYVLQSEKAIMQKNVIEFEPDQALFVMDNDPLLFYKAITDFAADHLLRPARLYFEINEKFGSAIRNLTIAAGFNEAQIIKDFQGKDRFVSARFY